MSLPHRRGIIHERLLDNELLSALVVVAQLRSILECVSNAPMIPIISAMAPPRVL